MIGNEIYKKNLQILKEQIPVLYDALNKTDTSHIKVTLIESDLNISINGQPLYPQNTSEYLGNKIEDFFSKPGAFYKNPPVLKKEVGIADINDSFVEKLEKYYDIYNKNNFKYDQYLDSVPVFIMFGIGTGQQIEQFLNLIDIKTLIVLDKDYSMLKTSMHIIDWEPIFKKFARPHYSLQIITGDKPFSLAAQTLNHIYKNSPYLAYYINYFYTYRTPFFEDVFSEIQKNYFNILTGWGFYDDEMLSLKHTISNIQNNCSVFNKNQNLSNNSNVFVIASGPSIDNDIEYIKKYKDNVVIFSCGTALRVLEKNGIVPDYHFEIERTKETFDILKGSVSKEFMKQVNFIGLNVIYPEVFDLFKTDKLFFRDFDCGSSIVPEDTPFIDDCNPTVFNGALAFASDIGFKNIYMFGADMGYKDESNHHSKYTIYGDKNHEKAKWKPQTDMEHQPNFKDDSVIHSTNILSWCKQKAENCITLNNELKQRNIDYFNCSDGAYIKGTKSLNSSDLLIKDNNKSIILEQIEKSFLHYDDKMVQKAKQQFKKEKELLFSNIDFMIDTISNNKVTSYSDMLDTLDTIFKKVFREQNNNKNSFSYSLLRGSTIHILTFLYTYSLTADNMIQSFDYINKGLKTLEELLLYIKKDVESIQFK
ncbi:MAG: 6-hydroxymethylpterin diphosphokinase MptE-like protein [Campylobacterota bacterium]|nr:6-hydroxymethylpterin diphosphokinase MptE-like protein [Campylobacterota bacterium]